MRYGVYVAHGMRCFWCNSPLDYINLTIDHVIAQDTSIDRILAIIEEYERPADFVIEDFRNWVPAHALCNSRKGNHLYAPMPAMLAALRRVLDRATKAEQTAREVRRNTDETKALLKFEADLANGVISIEESQNLIYKAQTDEFGWRVLSRSNGVESVTDGNVVAQRPIPDNDDVSWICGTCHCRGAWQGSICTQCGSRSGPD